MSTSGKRYGIPRSALRQEAAIAPKRPRNTAHMKILILEGDGIGPEISAATVRVMTRANEAFGLGMEFSYMPIGFAAMDKSKTTFPKETLEAAKRADGTVLGPVSHNDYPPV